MKIQRTHNKKLMLRLKHLVGTSALLAVLVGPAASASAEILYFTLPGTQQIQVADTSTHSTTPLFSTVGEPDSLLFDTSGNNILYTNLGNHEVRMYNRTTHLDSQLAGGFTLPADLALEPGGGSVLVSDYLGGSIYRINLSTQQVHQLGNYGGNPQGMAYDGSGRLFANLGTRSYGATSFLAELDPVTGAIIRQTAPQYSLDGLIFDPFSKELFATSTYGQGIFQIDPNTLAVSPLPNSTGVDLDGLTSDGAGNLYIAGDTYGIYRYNLATHTLVQDTSALGIDDLAPDSGLGSTPEPGTLTLLGTGIAGLAGLFRRHLIS